MCDLPFKSEGSHNRRCYRCNVLLRKTPVFIDEHRIIYEGHKKKSRTR